MKNFFLLFTLFICSTQAKKVVDGVEKTVVFVGMVGDLFHVGHINILKQAKSLGDYLMVGVTPDDDAKSYKRVPVLTHAEREQVIRACKYVDEIVPEPLQITKEFIEKYGIDIVVHGNDMNEEMLKFLYPAPIEMGILRLLPYTKGISTSNIIQRIVKRSAELRKPTTCSVPQTNKK